MKCEVDHANSINGRKILYKKNFFDIQMQQGQSEKDKDKLDPNMYSPQMVTNHFDLNDILKRKNIEPIKGKITKDS